MQDDSDEELFAHYRKKTEGMMKMAVAIFAIVFLFVLYTLING